MAFQCEHLLLQNSSKSYVSLSKFVMSCTPTQRIRFIQAAKDGNVVTLKKFVEDGVPVNTADNCGVSFNFFLYKFSFI